MILCGEATVESILQEAERMNVVDVLIDSLPEISKCVIRMHFWQRITNSRRSHPFLA